MNKMIIANLVHRPIRSLISIVAVAVEVTLILLIVGLSLGILDDSKQRQAGIGADIMVQPPGSSFLSGITGAPVSIKVADILRKVPHVVAVAPVVTQLSTAGAVEVIYGIDLASFEAMGGPFRYLAGGPFQGPNDILVDDFFAQQNKIKVGSTVEVLNHEFRVAGIVEHGKGARKFLPITTLQDLIGAQGKASIFYVKLDNPKNAEEVAHRIRSIPGMQKYIVRSLGEYLSLMTMGNIPGLSTFISVVIGVAVTIGFIVIFQAMYAAVMERTREIGILKSLGASKGYIISAILRETVLLAVMGIALGILVSYGARAAIVERFPLLRVIVARQWIVYATGIAIGGAILGAIYPAFKAAQKDPIDALAYE
ncbi:MAG TPA: ABC transporter permease [Terriglobales bacterium]|jgi:putative ABC transport system permease protein|nr:ABC transporter permease [Terriglobales bacterium]